VVEQAHAEEESVGRHLRGPAVDHDRGPLVRARVHIGGDPVPVLAGDEWTHLGVRVGPGADAQLG
jgi:hypothetical protein